MKRMLSLLLALVLALSLLPAPALADGTVEIGSAEAFIDFCRRCRVSSYSAGRRFLLTNDIDLRGEEISVPSFSGRFDGDGHTIWGVSLTGDGSRQGLFRTVTAEGVISDLAAQGTVAPGGTAVYVGGLVGENRGTVMTCAFYGEVRGVESVGGVVGLNAEGGAVIGCAFSGRVQAESKSGGVAGENAGVILSCQNDGDVNVEPVDRITRESFDISSLLDSGAESILAVSDAGGVTGLNTGTVSDCVNRGRVGYPGIGYNVGGVAGRSSGYVSGCENSGEVCARRDVGGIVGQLEPYAVWDLSRSKLEALDERMSELDEAVDAMAADTAAQTAEISGALSQMLYCVNAATDAIAGIVNRAADTGEAVRARIDELRDKAEEELPEIIEELENGAQDALDAAAHELEEALDTDGEPAPEIAPEPGTEGEPEPEPEPEPAPEPVPDIRVPDEAEREALLDELEKALEQAEERLPDTSALIDALSGVYGGAAYLASAVGSVSSVISDGAEEVSGRVAEVLDTLVVTARSVADVELDDQVDVSVAMAYEQDAGAVSACVNRGPVQAAVNAGGVVGTVGFEVAFDREEQLALSDLLFSEAQQQIFAVVRGCADHADIAVRDGYAGGVVGRLECGAVMDCLGVGRVTASEGGYVGGVAGSAAGSILDSCARGTVSGTRYVGGIAGLAADVSGCRACVHAEDAAEYVGGVAGWSDGVLERNVCADTGIGGVDGVERTGEAVSVSYADLLRMSGTPEEFSHCTVTLLSEDGAVFAAYEVTFGGGLDDLPTLPDRGNKYWRWDGIDLTHIYDDITLTGAYVPKRTVLATDDDPPFLLAEGLFRSEQYLDVTELDAADHAGALTGTSAPIGAWRVTVADYDGTLTVRLRQPEDAGLFILADGAPAAAAYARDGSYIVFSLENGGAFLLTEPEPAIRRVMDAAAKTALAAAGALTLVLTA